MTEVYKLVAVNAISRDLNGHQISSPNSCDVLLNPATGTWIGRGVGAADFRIPIDWIMYSTRHCHITYDAESRSWVVNDNSTNGTFLKVGNAWQLIGRGNRRVLAEGVHLRLSHPEVREGGAREALEYRLQCEMVLEPADSELHSASKVNCASADKRKGGALALAGSGGKRARNAATASTKHYAEKRGEEKGEEENERVMAQFLQMQASNQELRADLQRAADNQAALETQLAEAKAAAAAAAAQAERDALDAAEQSDARLAQARAAERAEMAIEAAARIDAANAAAGQVSALRQQLVELQESEKNSAAVAASARERAAAAEERAVAAEQRAAERAAAAEERAAAAEQRAAEAERERADLEGTIQANEASQAAVREELQRLGSAGDALRSRYEAANLEISQLRASLAAAESALTEARRRSTTLALRQGDLQECTGVLGTLMGKARHLMQSAASEEEARQAALIQACEKYAADSRSAQAALQERFQGVYDHAVSLAAGVESAPAAAPTPQAMHVEEAPHQTPAGSDTAPAAAAAVVADMQAVGDINFLAMAETQLTDDAMFGGGDIAPTEAGAPPAARLPGVQEAVQEEEEAAGDAAEGGSHDGAQAVEASGGDVILGGDAAAMDTDADVENNAAGAEEQSLDQEEAAVTPGTEQPAAGVQGGAAVAAEPEDLIMLDSDEEQAGGAEEQADGAAPASAAVLVSGGSEDEEAPAGVEAEEAGVEEAEGAAATVDVMEAQQQEEEEEEQQEESSEQDEGQDEEEADQYVALDKDGGEVVEEEEQREGGEEGQAAAVGGGGEGAGSDSAQSGAAAAAGGSEAAAAGAPPVSEVMDLMNNSQLHCAAPAGYGTPLPETR